MEVDFAMEHDVPVTIVVSHRLLTVLTEVQNALPPVCHHDWPFNVYAVVVRVPGEAFNGPSPY